MEEPAPHESEHSATQTIVVTCFLFLVFPIGVLLMWLWMKKWPPLAKALITVLPAFIFILTVSFYRLHNSLVEIRTENTIRELQEQLKDRDKIIENIIESAQQNP